MDPTEQRRRLDSYMSRRATDLGLTWVDLANLAGLSREGLRKVRRGETELRRLTKRGIEDGLRWKPGSVDSVLAGGEPEELDDEESENSSGEPWSVDRMIEDWQQVRDEASTEDRRRARLILEILRPDDRDVG